VSFSVSVKDRIATVSLSSPPLNILTAALQNNLCREIEALNARDDFNLLLLQSHLGVFSAGADVREHQGLDRVSAMLAASRGLIARLLECPVPTLCAVSGTCLGGALEVAIACDMLIARNDAKLGWPEIALGCFPPAALVLTAWKLPPFLASEMLTGGQSYPAADLAARGAGFLAAPESAFNSRVDAACKQYTALPRGALVETTRLIRPGAAQRFMAQVKSLEDCYLERVLKMRDSAEGVEAFLGKRPPEFDHRSP